MPLSPVSSRPSSPLDNASGDTVEVRQQPQSTIPTALQTDGGNLQRRTNSTGSLRPRASLSNVQGTDGAPRGALPPLDPSSIDLDGMRSAQWVAVIDQIRDGGDLIHVTHGSKPMYLVENALVAETLSTLGQRYAWREPFAYLDGGTACRYLVHKDKVIETVTQHQALLKELTEKYLGDRTQVVNTFIAARAAELKAALAGATTPRAIADVLLAALKDRLLPEAGQGILLGYGAENSVNFASNAWRWPWQMLTPTTPEDGYPAVPTFIAWNNPESVALLDRYREDASHIGNTVLKGAVVNGRRCDMQAARIVLASLFTERPQA